MKATVSSIQEKLAKTLNVEQNDITVSKIQEDQSRDAYMPSHPHFVTFTHIENFHLLSPALCVNHPQSPVFCLMEEKLPRQIFSQEDKRKIVYRSIQM